MYEFVGNMPPLSDFVVTRDNNTWQKYGQDQYALGNYAASLDAFTKVGTKPGAHLIMLGRVS